MKFRIEDRPDPFDIEFLETQIRREASAVMGVGDEVELAILVRDARYGRRRYQRLDLG